MIADNPYEFGILVNMHKLSTHKIKNYTWNLQLDLIKTYQTIYISHMSYVIKNIMYLMAHGMTNIMKERVHVLFFSSTNVLCVALCVVLSFDNATEDNEWI